jgi:hypothetical protein
VKRPNIVLKKVKRPNIVLIKDLETDRIAQEMSQNWQMGLHQIKTFDRGLIYKELKKLKHYKNNPINTWATELNR